MPRTEKLSNNPLFQPLLERNLATVCLLFGLLRCLGLFAGLCSLSLLHLLARAVAIFHRAIELFSSLAECPARLAVSNLGNRICRPCRRSRAKCREADGGASNVLWNSSAAHQGPCKLACEEGHEELAWQPSCIRSRKQLK